jgi:transcriptional regulator of heat shock response
MDFRFYMVPGDRRLQVLDAVIRIYTERAEPVSSAAVAQALECRWSPATVRNIFTELEQLGWLQRPHRAAGRVPTDQGYRVFVESIVRPASEDAAAQDWLRVELDPQELPLSELLVRAALLLSRISHALGLSQLILEPGRDAAPGGMRITGVDELLEQPEFKDPDRLRMLIHLLDDATPFGVYLRGLADSPGRVRLRIGGENSLSELSQFSLVTARIDRADETAFMGLLGPVRMEYPLVLGAMESLVRLLHSRAEDKQSWS